MTTVAPVLAHDVFPAAWPGVGLALMVVVAAFVHRLGRWGAVGLGVLSVLWLLNNKRMEGGTLVIFDADHGLNTTDLAGLAGLGLACWVLLRGKL